MGNVKKDRRVSDQDIIRLNHVGLSLKAIAEKLGCHAATITLRLKALNVAPSDTRRSFMEQVFEGLTTEEQDWLSHYLYNSQISIKDYMVSLLKAAYAIAPPLAAPMATPAMAEHQGEDVAEVQAAAEDAQETVPAVDPERLYEEIYLTKAEADAGLSFEQADAFRKSGETSIEAWQNKLAASKPSIFANR